MEALAAGGCDPVTVVVGAAAMQVRALVPAGARVVEARDWAQGMGASLRAGLGSMTDADPGAAADQMDRVNPIYVPRNHLVEEALEAAQSGDLVPFESLLARLSDPFTFAPGAQRYAEPAPDEFTEGFVTYCGT